MKFTLPFLFLMAFSFLTAQTTPLTYFLPQEDYDKKITSPLSFFGHNIGDWHLSHDQQYFYLKQLASESNRIELITLGHTHENRPLVVLAISAPDNIQSLESIQKQRHDWLAGKAAENPKMVIYQGNSIHGNEPSGGNAAVLYAYYLAASQNKALLEKLQHIVVFLDPCFNPDGFNRFASWVNVHKNKSLTNNSSDREYTEAWPGGRTNHYWFDLNRDWLYVRQPESKARIPFFQQWLPEVLTDHHEMGTDKTFFFQPGVPERVNPITPAKNQALTAAIGQYHAKALDEIRSLYFSKENYDDFFYGKGSTYPDIHGGIGILFEQASSRGHLQHTEHGDLSFAFTVKNQLTTQFSTLQAAHELKDELLAYKKDFFANAQQEAAAMSVKGYLVGETYDLPRLHEFLNILLTQQIDIYKVQNQTIDGRNFEEAYFIPTNQQRVKTVRAIFEPQTKFLDSIFYDVSAWVLPHAFNLAYSPSKSMIKGEKISKLPDLEATVVADKQDIAYILDWDSYFSPAALYYLLDKGVKVKTLGYEATFETKQGKEICSPGSILIYKQMSNFDENTLQKYVEDAARLAKCKIYGIKTGLAVSGYDAGSTYNESVRKPIIGLLVGNGVRSYDAGEVWHLFDQHYQVPVTKVSIERLRKNDFDDFNVLILVQGYYPKSVAVQLKEAMEKGTTVIVMRKASQWAVDNGLLKTEIPKEEQALNYTSYDNIKNQRGAYEIGGAIFETKIDCTHPLFYGYHNEKLPVFRNTSVFFNSPKNVYAAPSHYTASPLLAGYIKKDNLEKLKDTPAVLVGRHGKGRIVAIIDNPVFRDFWWGTNKVLANAVFFGHTIMPQATE